ncbi:MAG: bL21 family ribosomal protein, partial [Novosphingobium sp.]|nr:bL21 family ribosomal protein [Novosphingobium sp.]
VLGHEKAAKIVVGKYRRRKNYRRKQGHRQQFTRARVKDIRI